jgi:hypothetical protein
MKKKTLLLGCLFTLCYLQVCIAQSYEGYISGNLPVWVELNIPLTDGSFSGTYFYKNAGGIIPLSGTIKAKQIILNETNKDGICTGVFTCINFGDSITGNWKKPNSTKLSSVKLYKTDVSFKTYARIPDAAKLILSNGKTLNDELAEYTNEGSKKPKLVYLFAEKNILSTLFEWEYIGPYLSAGKVYHTFDLTKNKEISLLNEFDPAKLPELKSKMKNVIQKELNEHLKTYTENEWIDAFGDKETYEKSFKLLEVKDSLLGNYYLKSGMLYVVVDDYFAFPHVIQAMDFSFTWKLSFHEMGLYLKDGSVLNKLK